MRFAIGKVGLDPIGIAKHLLNFRNRYMTFRVIGTKVPAIGGIPDDLPIVHPFSIYQLGRQEVGMGRIWRTTLLSET